MWYGTAFVCVDVLIHFCRSNVVGLRLLKAIISGTTSRHMIDHHVGTRGTRQRSFVLMYAIHRLYLGQVHLVNVNTFTFLTSTTIYLELHSYYQVEFY